MSSKKKEEKPKKPIPLYISIKGLTIEMSKEQMLRSPGGFSHLADLRKIYDATKGFEISDKPLMTRESDIKKGIVIKLENLIIEGK